MKKIFLEMTSGTLQPMIKKVAWTAVLQTIAAEPLRSIVKIDSIPEIAGWNMPQKISTITEDWPLGSDVTSKMLLKPEPMENILIQVIWMILTPTMAYGLYEDVTLSESKFLGKSSFFEIFYF